jgi:hypothetical protein
LGLRPPGKSNVKERTVNIKCPTFQIRESLIKDITDKMYRAKEAQEEAGLAEELKKEVEILLRCQAIESHTVRCKDCHFISTLRKRVYNMVIRANGSGRP